MLGLALKWIKNNPKVLIALGLLVIVACWSKWSMNRIDEIAQLKADENILRQDVSRLTVELESYIDQWGTMDAVFDSLNQEQVDLICEARYIDKRPLPKPLEPATVEVIRYVDRVTGCPTEDRTAAEQPERETTFYRPVDEDIALGSVNNAWKAYCIATNNEDPSCIR